ncbi:DUF294 nucleotidyltransferase-like domain-containing protein [Lysinibacillus antri]|uniref:CBS domain-containing protein n=1 Tax=Lysinibacillus antri TaxID=2498145 RepID=A0A432LG25_9BACI|nr:DUF294 nucleotidyltransferase-like domain-containing protein [Lysinibacillus antri]RUL56876.1 hypothetical protein EK386_00180 [Lysinibacillus antri]
METYEAIKQWKDANITAFFKSNRSLNEFHDQIMRKVFQVASDKLNQPPPCDYAWFITGSGGRFEQGRISDQDHGIVYEQSTDANNEYFIKLGEEISYGLDVVGYPYCTGNIMSSNPIWCKSFEHWKLQLVNWMEKETWETIRYVQIFYDARVLVGKSSLIEQLKSTIYQYQLEHPTLIRAFMTNIKHIKNGIGPMGQFLVEPYGGYQGCINLKYTAFLPYVNSIRLLSIKEGIFETSTIDRIYRLMEMEKYHELLQNCTEYFEVLTKYRLSLTEAEDYDDTHYLHVKQLTKDERKELKRILLEGKRLHDEVKKRF